MAAQTPLDAILESDRTEEAARLQTVNLPLLGYDLLRRERSLGHFSGSFLYLASLFDWYKKARSGHGLLSYLDVIYAQTVLLANQRTATQVTGQRLVATVVLIKALGGGWLALPAQPGTNLSAGAPATGTNAIGQPALTAGQAQAYGQLSELARQGAARLLLRQFKRSGIDSYVV